MFIKMKIVNWGTGIRPFMSARGKGKRHKPPISIMVSGVLSPYKPFCLPIWIKRRKVLGVRQKCVGQGMAEGRGL